MKTKTIVSILLALIVLAAVIIPVNAATYAPVSSVTRQSLRINVSGTLPDSCYVTTYTARPLDSIPKIYVYMQVDNNLPCGGGPKAYTIKVNLLRELPTTPIKVAVNGRVWIVK
jgi:hypothetical protein